MQDLEVREDIRKKLEKIRRQMMKYSTDQRVSFLTKKMAEWGQDIINHKDKFRIEMAKGELNIDPEIFEIELDEEKWALGILQLWINELETAVEFGDEVSVLVETKSVDLNKTIEDVPLNENYDGLWNIKQVAKYLNLSVDYIYQLTRKELIPLNKVGNRVLFRKEDIDNWLLEKKS